MNLKIVKGQKITMTLQSILNEYFNQMISDLLLKNPDKLGHISITLHNSIIEDSSNTINTTYNIDIYTMVDNKFRTYGISKNVSIIDSVGNEQIISSESI